MSKTKEIFFKLKHAKFCILIDMVYWKDPTSILLSCILEDEEKKYYNIISQR